MKVLIYEDNIKDLNLLIEYLNKFCCTKNIKLSIKICQDANQVFDYAISADLIFLDIEGPDENGINIGVKIRQINTDAKIIFVSNYSKYLIDGYKALASRYFIKPIDWDFFKLELEDVFSDYMFNNAGFTDLTIYSKKIYYKEIMFIEFINRKTVLHLISGKEIETSYSLKYWAELLDEYYFAQPYKPFLVNLRQVSNITKQEVILSNNESVPLSRLYKKEFEAAYIQSLKRRL